MEEKDDINSIKSLLGIKDKEFPYRVTAFKKDGKIFDFFLKKAFWNQVYGRFIVEFIQYPDDLVFDSYKDIIRSESKLLTKETIIVKETEELCLIELNKFLSSKIV